MNNSSYDRQGRRSRGLTLIELLVVAGLMILLISVAAPVLNPIAEGRQAREAVRGVHGALESARSRAMRLGRPCGVSLSAFSNSEDKSTYYPVCIQLEQLTAPPDIVTECTVSNHSITVSDVLYEAHSKNSGDLLQINYTGPWYRKSGMGAGATWSTNFPGTSISTEYPTGTYPCVIRRVAIPEDNIFAKILGVDSVFTIPRGIVVDLAYSGIGDSGVWGSNVKNVSIIFQPDGTVSLYVGNKEQIFSNSENSHIFLLVGRWDRGLGMAEDGERNIQDQNSFWLIINPQTGMIVSAINNPDTNVQNARSFAIQSLRDSTKILGGR